MQQPVNVNAAQPVNVPMPAQGAAPAPFQSASLYIGDLNPEVTEGLLFELFNRVGPVASIRVCRDMVTRRSLGYAYVNFHQVQDAERALDTMNFTDIKGRPCRIMWSQRDPSLRKSGLGNIFVKNLAPSIDNKGLFDIFSVFGNILSCKVATDETGNSKGYGYIHYETGEAAQEAIAKLNGHMIDDEEVYVGLFLRRQDRASNAQWTNLYVKHFPEFWTEEQLYYVFGKFGEIASCKIQVDAEGRSKLFGFVDFRSHESALKAIDELHEKIIETGQYGPNNEALTVELYVSRAQKKSERLREIKSRVDAIKLEQANKYQGMNLYVKNLDEAVVTDDSFRETFAPYGTITSAHIMRDEAGASRGFGFICYSTPEEATRALQELNGKMIGNKPLFVALHQRKDIRRAHLTATYNNRGQGGMPRGFPMGGQPPMHFGMNMYVQNQMPRQPYPMPMMPRGPLPQYAGRGQGQYVGQYPMGGMQNQYKGRGMNPQAQQRRPIQNAPRGSVPPRGMIPQQPQRVNPAMKFNSQVRNQSQGQMMPQMMQSAVHIPTPGAQLDHNTLALADPQTQKNMIGERLYPLIVQSQPNLAGKITGMLLEMDNAELLHLLESPEALAGKIDEAIQVLEAHHQEA